MFIKQIVNGRWKENCYVVSENNEALIIDPGSEPENIINYINENKLKPIAILNTHGHYDHIGAVADLKDKFNIPFYLHSEDVKTLKHANLYLKFFDGEKPVKIPEVDHIIDELENPFKIANFVIETLFTPGHTKGSVCFIITDNIFTGDLLFKGNIGRTDLPGGNKEVMKNSLNELSTLGNLTVYPGHGDKTKLEQELLDNELFIEAVK